LSGSERSGTLAFLENPRQPSIAERVLQELNPLSSATAASSCATFETSQGSGCDASGATMWLSYSDCTFAEGKAFWTGTQGLFMTSTADTASCGTFPNPGSGGYLTRQVVSASGSTTPDLLTIKNSYGTTAYVDDKTADLGNFDSQPIGKLINNGYGSQVSFNGPGGSRDSITIAQRLMVSVLLDESVTGTLSVSETVGSTQRTVSGSLTVYHNLLKVVGTSTFQNVVHTDGCCYPSSGTISTTFSAGSHESPTALGALLVGKTETLEITACGTGTLTSVNGSVQTVALTRCY
jgi:hypothetical protein